MVLRKERPPFTGAASSAMNNEQPVSKRQRIDGLLIINGANGESSRYRPDNNTANTSTSTASATAAAADVDELDHIGLHPAHQHDINADYYLPPNDAIAAPFAPTGKFCDPPATPDTDDVWLPLDEALQKQCLCELSRRDLLRPLRPHNPQTPGLTQLPRPLSEWPAGKLIAYLSQLQLLLDIYLKQSRNGHMCQAICTALDVAERTALVPDIIALADNADRFVQYLATRVLCTFLIFANESRRNVWLKLLADQLFEADSGEAHTRRVGFSLEIFRRILEWNDEDLHPLGDDVVVAAATSSDDGSDDDLSEEESDGGSVERDLPPIETNYFNFYTQYDGNHQSVAASAAAAAASSASASASSGHAAALATSTSNAANAIASSSGGGGGHHRQRASPTMSSSVSVTSSSASASTSRGYSDAEHEDDRDDDELDDEGDDEDDDDDDDAQSVRADIGCTHLDVNCLNSTKLKKQTALYIADRWPVLLGKMSVLLGGLMEPAAAVATANPNRTENLIHTFLELWRTIIAGSAKTAFLNVNETQPFYAELALFEEIHLRRQLPPVIYKQLLQLFNAVLCYGDALATEMAISDETYKLAHRIISHLQDGSARGLLQSMPLTDVDNPVSLIGFAGRSTSDTMVDAKKRRAMQLTDAVSSVPLDGDIGIGGIGACDKDKTYLQNMVLLVLKSVAVSVRVMRSDSSDSSIDSSDMQAYAEFRTIARTMCPLLEKLNEFSKNGLQLHPALHFSRMLVTLFIDQDDFLIEAMVCTLDVAAGFQFGSGGDEPSFGALIWLLNPVYTFLEFLSQTNRNWELLFNYLISSETCFLLYFLRFLKYITVHWTQFALSCDEFGELYGQRDVCQHTMALLGELRKEIGDRAVRGKFPYDIWPVLKLMDKCAALWECPL